MLLEVGWGAVSAHAAVTSVPSRCSGHPSGHGSAGRTRAGPSPARGEPEFSEVKHLGSGDDRGWRDARIRRAGRSLTCLRSAAIGLISTFVALLAATLIGSSLQKTGGPRTWVLATLIGWRVTGDRGAVAPGRPGQGRHPVGP